MCSSKAAFNHLSNKECFKIHLLHPSDSSSESRTQQTSTLFFILFLFRSCIIINAFSNKQALFEDTVKDGRTLYVHFNQKVTELQHTRSLSSQYSINILMFYCQDYVLVCLVFFVSFSFHFLFCFARVLFAT